MVTFMACFALLFPAFLWADLVFVERATGTGVASSDLDVATHLVRTSVAEVSSHTVTDDLYKAEYVLRPRLMKLGEGYILGLDKLKQGKLLFSTQLKAARMEELDVVAERVTRSVIGERNAKKDFQVDQVTENESREGIHRRPSRQVRSISFGPGGFSALNSSRLAYSFGASYGWDVNRAIVKLVGDLAVAGSALLGNVGLGGNVYLTMSDTAPFVFADFGYGFSKAEEAGALLSGESSSGFNLGIGAGVTFLRTSSISVDVSGRFGTLLASNAFGHPTIYCVRVGLVF